MLRLDRMLRATVLACLGTLALFGLGACATGPLVAIRPTKADLKGMVYDLDRQAVAGAKVSLEGTSFSVTTDLHGRFGLPSVPLGLHVLQFAKEGYEPLSWEFRFVDPTEVVYLQAASFDQLVSQSATALEKQEWSEFTKLMDRARQVQPTSLALVILEATSLERRGDKEGAFALVLDATSGRDVFLLERYLGDLAATMGKNEVAAEHWRKALGLQEDGLLRTRLHNLGS